MNRSRSVEIFAVLCVFVVSSSVFASGFMGPPKSELGKGQYSIGFDYSYSKGALELGEGKGTSISNRTVKKWKSDALTARFGYGLTDGIDVSFLLGGAQMRYSDVGERFSGDEEWAYGFGTKVTLAESEKLTWGGLFQMSWYEAEGKWSGPGWVGDSDVDYSHIQIAFGPTYKLSERLAIYGGPFWQCIDGEKTWKAPGEWEKYDIDAASNCGGYLGLQFDMGENALLGVEYQLTSDDDILGLSLSWLF